MSETLQTGDALLAELEAELAGDRSHPGTPLSASLPSTPKRDAETGEPVPRREYVALQQEVIELKAAQYEAANREKALKAELAKLMEKEPKKGVFLDNIFRRDKDKLKGKKPGDASEQEDDKTKEIHRLSAQIKTLESELSLHKETKDQLARELDSTRADLDDQRHTFKASISSLNMRNAQMEEALRANNLEALIPSQADCPSPSKSSPTASSAGSPEQQTSADNNARLQDVLQEKQLLSAKVSRMEEEAVANMNDLETLRSQIRKLNKENERIQRAIKSSRSQVKDLQAEVQTKEAVIEKERECSKRLVEEISSLDVKIKWTENKLHSETEKLEAATQELIKTQKRAKELKEENEQVKSDHKSMIESLQHTNQVTASTASGLETTVATVQKELAESRQRYSESQAELQKAHDEIDKLKEELQTVSDRLINEQNLAARYKEQMEEFREKSLGYDDLRENMQHTLYSKKALEQENKLLIESTERGSTALTAAQHQIDTLQAEKAAGNEAAKELKATINTLESQIAQQQQDIQDKAHSIAELTQQLQQHAEKIRQLETQLDENRTAAQAEQEKVAMEAKDLQSKVESLQIELADAHSALQLHKKKSASALKDMARQLQSAEKKVQRSRVGGGDSTDDVLSVHSFESNEDRDFGRTSSQSEVLSPGSHSRSAATSAALRGVTNVGRIQEDMSRLLQELEKRNERLQFYESHVADLTEDLKQKNKVIQQYLLREQTGALSTSAIDENKLARSKQKGMMASMFKGSGSKEMTLEMAMEINSKLQEVLEDSLLKNIQLKESMDVLSKEIARLSSGAGTPSKS